MNFVLDQYCFFVCLSQMNIDDFMRMLHVNSVDSLDMYDERNSSVGSSSAGKLSVLQVSKVV